MPASVLIALCAAVTAVSCSGTPDQVDAAVHAEDDALSTQMQCVQEWRQMIGEWEDSSSRSATSLTEVREELKRGATLRVAKLAQNAWRLQAQEGRLNSRQIGEWPVPESVKRSVISAMDDAAEGVVSRGCQQTAVFVLPLLLGEEVASERPTSPLRNVDVSQVDPTRTETSRIGHWLFYWLLIAE